MTEDKYVTDTCSRKLFRDMKKYIKIDEVKPIPKLKAKVYSFGGLLFVDDDLADYIGIIIKVPGQTLCRKCNILYPSDKLECPSCGLSTNESVRKNAAYNTISAFYTARSTFNSDSSVQKKLKRLFKQTFGVSYKEID